MMGFAHRTVWLVLTLVLAPIAAAVEFVEIDSPAADGSLAPRLVTVGTGEAVLTWLQPTTEGHRFSFAHFDNGTFGTVGTVHEGDGYFANWADTPGLAVMPGGTWLAHWLERSGKGTYAYDVKAAVSHDQGVTWSPAFSPHDDGTFTEHGFVSNYPSGDSELGLVWLDGRETAPAVVDGGMSASEGHDGHAAHGAMTLRTARIDRTGGVRGGALLDARVCDCCATAAALTGEGPVVVYRDRSDDEVRDIMLVRREATGWSKPVAVHDDQWQINACPVNGPAVLARGSTVVVAWFTLANDGIPRVRIAQSMDAGRTFSSPVTLDAGIALGRVDLAWTNDGFALAWLAEVGERGVLRLALFNPAGAVTGRHDLVELESGRASGFPRMVGIENSRLLVAWTGFQRVRVGTVLLQ